LITYLIGEKITIFSKILSEVQNKNQSQVTKLIAQCGAEQQDNFHEWLQSKLSELIIFLFKAIREQDRRSVNLLLAGMNSQQVNIQEKTTNDTALHIAIEIWMQQKDTSSTSNALSIIWSLLLKGAELKNVQNAKGKFPFDLIQDPVDRDLIESYARDAKHYIDLEKNSYIETKVEESTIC